MFQLNDKELEEYFNMKFHSLDEFEDIAKGIDFRKSRPFLSWRLMKVYNYALNYSGL